MKLKINNKRNTLLIGIAALLAGFTTFSSCVDEDLDISKMSKTIQIGKSFGVPAGTAEFSIMDLLEKYDTENNPLFSIETYPDSSIVFEYSSVLKVPNPWKYKPATLPTPLPDSIILPTVSADIDYDMMRQLPDGCILVPHQPYMVYYKQNTVIPHVSVKLKDIQTVGTSGAMSCTYNKQIELTKTDTIWGGVKAPNSMAEMISDPMVDTYTFNFEVKAKFDVTTTSDDDSIELHNKICFPVWLDANSYLTYSDTIKDFDMGDLTDNDFLNTAILACEVTNSLPFDVTLTFTMLDDSYNPITTAGTYKKHHFQSATVDTDGKVIAPNTEIVKLFKYDELMRQDLMNTKHLKIQFEIPKQETATTSKTTKPIQLRTNNKIGLKAWIYTNDGILFKE